MKTGFYRHFAWAVILALFLTGCADTSDNGSSAASGAAGDSSVSSRSSGSAADTSSFVEAIPSAETTTDGSSAYPDAFPVSFGLQNAVGETVTVLNIEKDGSFEGEYCEMDADDNRDDYPEGVCYYSQFRGQFNNIQSAGSGEWTMDLGSLEVTGYPQGDMVVQYWDYDNKRYIYTSPAGITNEASYQLGYSSGEDGFTLTRQATDDSDSVTFVSTPDYESFNLNLGDSRWENSDCYEAYQKILNENWKSTAEDDTTYFGDTFCYALKDLNGDNQPELLVGRYDGTFHILEIWTCTGDSGTAAPERVFESGGTGQYMGMLMKNGIIADRRPNGNNSVSWMLREMGKDGSFDNIAELYVTDSSLLKEGGEDVFHLFADSYYGIELLPPDIYPVEPVPSIPVDDEEAMQDTSHILSADNYAVIMRKFQPDRNINWHPINDYIREFGNGYGYGYEAIIDCPMNICTMIPYLTAKTNGYRLTMVESAAVYFGSEDSTENDWFIKKYNPDDFVFGIYGNEIEYLGENGSMELTGLNVVNNIGYHYSNGAVSETVVYDSGHGGIRNSQYTYDENGRVIHVEMPSMGAAYDVTYAEGDDSYIPEKIVHTTMDQQQVTASVQVDENGCITAINPENEDTGYSFQYEKITDFVHSGSKRGSAAAGEAAGTAASARGTESEGWKSYYSSLLDDAEETNQELQQANNTEDFVDKTMPGYYLYDIDRDGVPELILIVGTALSNERGRVFTWENGSGYQVGTEDLDLSHGELYSDPDENGVIVWQYQSGTARMDRVSIADQSLMRENILLEGLGSGTSTDDYTKPDTLIDGAQQLAEHTMTEDFESAAASVSP